MERLKLEASIFGLVTNPRISAQRYLKSIIAELKMKIEPSKEKKMNCKAKTEYGMTNIDNTSFLYYVGLINDTLSQIRKGKIAYIFNLQQICDIIKYEPKAKFSYVKESDSFSVYL